MELNSLKLGEIRKCGTDVLEEKSWFSEIPHIDEHDIDSEQYEIDDSEREKIELPYIGDNTEKMYISEAEKNEEIYAPSMEVQAEKINDIYNTIPELQYDKWKSLDLDERKVVLNDFEKRIAAIEKRPPMPVEYEKTRLGVMGYNDGKKLVISDRILRSDDFSDYKETLNTLFHEGRHSYQNYNLYVQRTERSDETYNAWVVNREKLGYSSGSALFPFNLSEVFRQKSFYQYYTQPVEVDARLFAETVENKIGLNAREYL